jgi:hypothetical protein
MRSKSAVPAAALLIALRRCVAATMLRLQRVEQFEMMGCRLNRSVDELPNFQLSKIVLAQVAYGFRRCGD